MLDASRLAEPLLRLASSGVWMARWDSSTVRSSGDVTASFTVAKEPHVAGRVLLDDDGLCGAVVVGGGGVLGAGGGRGGGGGGVSAFAEDFCGFSAFVAALRPFAPFRLTGAASVLFRAAWAPLSVVASVVAFAAAFVFRLPFGCSFDDRFEGSGFLGGLRASGAWSSDVGGVTSCSADAACVNSSLNTGVSVCRYPKVPPPPSTVGSSCSS